MEAGAGAEGTDLRLERALRHPVRAKIHAELTKQPMQPPELAAALDVPLSRISYHYRVLLVAGAVFEK